MQATCSTCLLKKMPGQTSIITNTYLYFRDLLADHSIKKDVYIAYSYYFIITNLKKKRSES